MQSQFFKSKAKKLSGTEKTLNDIAKEIIDTTAEKEKENLKKRALELGVAPEDVDKVFAEAVKAAEEEGVKRLHQLIEKNTRSVLTAQK